MSLGTYTNALPFMQIVYICISQKNPFFFTRICLLTNIETKMRYNSDNDGI
jgi:hypothetical protein